jgi:hypothetical protein
MVIDHYGRVSNSKNKLYLSIKLYCLEYVHYQVHVMLYLQIINSYYHQTSTNSIKTHTYCDVQECDSDPAQSSMVIDG